MVRMTLWGGRRLKDKSISGNYTIPPEDVTPTTRHELIEIEDRVIPVGHPLPEETDGGLSKEDLMSTLTILEGLHAKIHGELQKVDGTVDEQPGLFTDKEEDKS